MYIIFVQMLYKCFVSTGRLCCLNFHPLEVVSRYRGPQLQVGENYSYLFNLRQKNCKSFSLNARFIPSNGDKQIENDYGLALNSP